MTETEWKNAAKPFTCKEIAENYGTARKLRLLMVGYLEPLQCLMSSRAKGVFSMLQEWAEDESKTIDENVPWSAPDGPLGNYMEWSASGLAAAAVDWVVHHGSRIEPQWTYSIAMPAVELKRQGRPGSGVQQSRQISKGARHRPDLQGVEPGLERRNANWSTNAGRFDAMRVRQPVSTCHTRPGLENSGRAVPRHRHLQRASVRADARTRPSPRRSRMHEPGAARALS